MWFDVEMRNTFHYHPNFDLLMRTAISSHQGLIIIGYIDVLSKRDKVTSRLERILYLLVCILGKGAPLTTSIDSASAIVDTAVTRNPFSGSAELNQI